MAVDPGDADVLHVVVPERVTFGTVGTVLEQLEPSIRSAEANEPCRLVLDMRAVKFCSPTGITLLAAAMEDLYRRGLLAEGAIRIPNRQFVLQYLERMNFFKELEVNLPTKLKPRKKSKKLHPVTHIRDEGEVASVVRGLVETLRPEAKLDERARGTLVSCVSEVVENVFYHAGSPIDALVCAQANSQHRRAELVIADTGRGIKEALTGVEAYRGQIDNDCAAIRLALEKNVTNTGDPHRGIGLWVVSEVIRSNGGELLILSKEGGVRIGPNGDMNVFDHFWPGTLVVIEFKTDQPIDTVAVYGSAEFPNYGDDDLNF